MSDELSRKLGYQFIDKNLLKLALTHRSRAEENNERLEFLGDSIVNFVIAEALYKQFPHAQEGELSRWRASLVNRTTLGELGRGFELGRYIHLGPGELKSGGSERESTLSCTMEAVIGAIFLDAGFLVVRDCLLKWYEPLLAAILNTKSLKDPKTTLQEYLQKEHMPLPVYTVEKIGGQAHQQLFTVNCTIEGVKEKAVGQGSSRRRAEQAAAEAMLGMIKS